MRRLLALRSTQASVLRLTDAAGQTALSYAAEGGHVEAMRVLLDHPSADPATMLVVACNVGITALMHAAAGGHVGAMRVLLDHPSANPATMMMLTCNDIHHSLPCGGQTALSYAAAEGHVEAMRVLLDHPAADPAAMIAHTSANGSTAFARAAYSGHLDALRLLLDHPSADPAAMLAFDSAHFTGGYSAIVAATISACNCVSSASADSPPTRPFAPLLFLLRRVAADPQLCVAQDAHMTRVMEEMVEYDKSIYEDEENGEIFGSGLLLLGDDHPDDARDEAIRLLLELGAGGYDPSIPVIKRVIRELAQQARVPQLLNEAVLGVAIARQYDKPRGV
jgi:hypothetical protein